MTTLSFRNVFTSPTKKPQTLATKLHALSHVSPRQPLMWFLSHLSIPDVSHKCNYTSCCWRMLLKTTHSFTTVTHHGPRVLGTQRTQHSLELPGLGTHIHTQGTQAWPTILSSWDGEEGLVPTTVSPFAAISSRWLRGFPPLVPGFHCPRHGLQDHAWIHPRERGSKLCAGYLSLGVNILGT